MKKQLIVLLLSVPIICIAFSGCFGTSSDDEKNKIEGNTFIGTWETYPYYYVYGNRINETPSTATIYENGTMRTESVVNDEIIWNPYTIENNKFCMGEPSDSFCYDYEFSNNGNKVILSTVYQDEETGEWINFFVDLIRV
jgi:hypothetical protein